MMIDLTRRKLLTLTSGGVALAAAGLGVRAAFRRGAVNNEILVTVFLRFGSDGLTMIAPAEETAYLTARPTIAVRAEGETAGLAIGRLDGVPFYMNPNIPELKALYDAGHLAVVQAVGLPTNTRSHFESQDMLERGITESNQPIGGGWMARHLLSQQRSLPDLGVVAAAPDVQVSLHGYRAAVAVPDVAQFNVTGGDFNLNTIERLNSGPEPIAASARETAALIRRVQGDLTRIPPARGGVIDYPGGSFSEAMKSLATLIKMNAGLEVAAVDFGGWDHHYNMNQYFPPHARQLSKTLAAFWQDLEDYRDRLTVVTMTEFGRRLDENTAGGTDHGAASYMLVLGGRVNGGRLYGRWPGLRAQDLRDGDLRITTDARHVLQEILVKRRREQAIENVFPGLPYQPLGILV